MTGSSSFVGRELLAQCDAAGIEVSGIDMAAPARPDCTRADIRDRSIGDLIPERADAVVHLAALSRDADCRGRLDECFDVNVMGTLNLAAAANRRRARQFIFASSEWVYDAFVPGVAKTEDDPVSAHALASEYALSKLVGEVSLRQLHAQGSCAVTVLRFGIIYGPRGDNWSAVESLLHRVATQPQVQIGARATARCFVHVADIAAALRAAVGVPGYDIFNIQGDRAVTLGEIVDHAARLLGRSPVLTETDPANPSVKLVSNAKAVARLDWRPRIGIEDGLESVADFLGLATRRAVRA